MECKIIHNQKESRFETLIDGNLAYVEYIPFRGGLNFTHTWVPKELEGQGVASLLVKFALDYTKENNLEVIPTCPFVKAFVKRHPEYK
jgi:Predicted acetyltransferase